MYSGSNQGSRCAISALHSGDQRRGRVTRNWLGKAVHSLKGTSGDNGAIFQYSLEASRKLYQKSGSWLGLPGLHVYQLRHGGASDDLCAKLRDHNGVKDRGRWQTDTSVKRYAKAGKIQKLLSRMPKWSIQYCKQSVQCR